MGRSTLVIVACLGIALGCVERAPELSPADRERLREYIGTDAPSPAHSIDAQFDNGVRLLGYDLSTESVRPGQAFTVTWHWQATQNLDDGWRLFTHIADGTGESRFNQDGEGIVRELYQPGRWQAGQYIRDEQEITLPEDWNNPRAVFYLGLWQGDHRLAVRTGPNDGDNRVRALEIDVASGPTAARTPAAEGDAPTPPRPPPLTRANRAEDIDIDGEANEAAWAEARETTRFVNTLDGSQAELAATARVLWDDDNVYVAWQIADDFVSNDLDERDAHLWEQDAFEIMVDPDGDGRNYFELQVSPTGQTFDTRYDTRRQPQPIGHVDWNPEVEVAVHVNGTVNDDEADEGWSGEIAIPWSAFGDNQAAPSRGDVWRVNFYVMDKRPGDAGQRSAGWSPTLERDFHVPARFGRIFFNEPEPEPEPQAAVETTPPAPGLIPTQVQLRPSVGEAVREALNQGNLRRPPGVARNLRPQPRN